MAPGEAEAECSWLQQEGIVDAVWTDDGDALMFGTTMLIKTHYERAAPKSKTHVKAFRADDIKRDYGLDQDGFMLFALLVGGDYEIQGLPGCGPKITLKLAKERLGRSLRECLNAEIHVWRRQLESDP
jgi:Holliday junction resolvase YEN1